MRHRAWFVALLVGLLLLSGWSVWQVRRLSDEVERLSRTDDLEAPAARAQPSAAEGPPEAPLTLQGPTSASPAVAERLAEQDQKIARALALLDRVEAEWNTARRGLLGLIQAHIEANELAAIAVSRNVTSALAQMQASAKVDVDQDGTGEYAGFLESSGASAGRMGSVLVPPVLASAFRVLNEHGEARRGGYLMRICLPGPGGKGVGETSTGFEARAVDADLAETTWCLYAWPVEHGATGTRTFFVNQGGDVLFTESASYSGPGAGPAPEAAFLPGARAITGLPALDAVGADGNRWSVIR